jgi:polygalacturonase
VVRWLKLRKPIAWNLAIAGNNNHIYGNKIDAAYDLDTPSVFPFNTDGYDISGNNVLVEDSWVFNGDDCIAGETCCTFA